MSLSPARQHRLRIQAESASRLGGSARHANGYELMLMQLNEDRRRLKGIQSHVRKAEIKITLLPKYLAWINGVIEANSERQDDVLLYVMVWAIDAADFDLALRITEHALTHRWVMPMSTPRNVVTWVVEEISDSALKALATKQEFAADTLLRVLSVTEGCDMPDQSLARLHKAIGYVLRDVRPMAALNHLNQALALHDRCGVKKDIEQLVKRLQQANG
ncbi:phage terminase small subunit [Rosenbergiella australiborealis]|uniref:phage terminase small subunit n=1 Tax=Rosenbergiella australiborealis TaxID=1544696 RepID=UPI001F4ED208|nr:phage terminase small subunit [Rosenbergiella australiborealis]